MQQLRDRLSQSEENEKIYSLESEELREELALLREKFSRTEALVKQPTLTEDYLQQLKSAQENLYQYNQHINKLLQQKDLPPHTNPSEPRFPENLYRSSAK